MSNSGENLTLLREGVDWVDLLTSGSATEADAQALLRWRCQSPAHAQAFREAVVFRDALVQLRQERLLPKSSAVWSSGAATVNRRAVLAGGLAASSACAAYAVVHPPLGLWPSLAELSADFRTAKGEQRNVVLSDGLFVEMNTSTSLSRRSDHAGMRLIHGEVAVSAKLTRQRPWDLAAGNGVITATEAQFDVRYDADTVCVACNQGSLRVSLVDADITLAERQQVTYGERHLGQILQANPAVVSAWRAGLIVLRDASLAQAVAEINRYRAGMIVIANQELRQQHVNTVLHLSRLDQAIPLICRVTGAHATAVGDYVFLT